MERNLLLVPWFKRFIRESEAGIRNKVDGSHIKKSSIKNYYMVLAVLVEFEKYSSLQIKMRKAEYLRPALVVADNKYWDDIYRRLCDFCYEIKCFHDNYTGMIFKCFKAFLFYMKDIKCLISGGAWERFYVRKENIPIVTIMPEQLSFLILDSAFEESLKPSLKKTKDMFVFGCTAALRFSDLANLRVKDVELNNGKYFLCFRSIKTGTPVRVNLPFYAITIYRHYARLKSPEEKLFPYAALSNFNNRLRKIAWLAGWRDVVGKYRCCNGCSHELKTKKGDPFLFCDLISSHVMRRTGITVLLMMGVPEYLVRKISGHSAHSKEFFRYVNFADTFITTEITKAQLSMLSTYH